MKQIEIEDDLYKYILTNIEAFGETPSQILRRLLSLPAADENNTLQQGCAEKSEPVVSVPENEIKANPPAAAHTSASSLSEPLAHGVEVLFDSEVFKLESVVTNKFMMMLTAMYYENKDRFVEAAEKTKGRTRDYLGQNLSALLASDNQEELALFKASKPRAIPNTPFWVITNANTGRKRIILTQMMACMGYPHHLIERIKEEI
ncbi:Negative modulator of initiation of replication [Psychromonas aquimarina]|uniref:Negative modulator of initiation of replication n=1 Tax=Psychromonas aquimarina TaxID=444919 RepID=UPI000413F8C0|nr:Negative modulator of initiation of replication [Psychromonas aquimarina]